VLIFAIFDVLITQMVPEKSAKQSEDDKFMKRRYTDKKNQIFRPAVNLEPCKIDLPSLNQIVSFDR